MRSARSWVLAAGAAAFWYAAWLYLTIPDVRPLATRPPATTAFIELRDAQARADGRTPVRRQRWVAYRSIAPSLKRAVIVAEDSAFWQHDGIDLEQIRESVEVNLERMEFARGASTITQQLAKNLYLSPSKNPARKIREVMIARRLEAVLTKQRILELYLNEIEWGNGIYGAEAAARAYFGKAAAGLGPEESALLAAAVVNPRALDPGQPSPKLRRRQRMILRRMGAATLPPETGPSTTVPADSPGAGLPRSGNPAPVGGERAAEPGLSGPPPPVVDGRFSCRRAQRKGLFPPSWPWERPAGTFMIHYTDRLNTLIRDIVARVEPLSFIDPDRLLVFGRVGRTGAAGAYATCHSLNLPPSEPGYYFWRDRATGELTRRSEWFVTKSPELMVGGRTVDYMLSFSLPRFCDQSLHRSRKAIFYPGEPAWIAKLDTVVHELYHISPSDAGLRRFERADGETSPRYHSADFYHQVSSLVREYLATHPSMSTYEFLRHDFSRPRDEIRQRARDDLPQLPVVSAAVSRATRRPAAGAAREDGADQGPRRNRRATPNVICACGSSSARVAGSRAAAATNRSPPEPRIRSRALLARSDRHAPRAEISLRPVGRIHPVHTHDASRVRRVHEASVPERDADVRGPARRGREEDADRRP